METNQPSLGGTAVAAAAKPVRRLVLQIHEVKCVDETNSGTAEIFGGDEIDLAGISIDASGRVTRLPTLDLGGFSGDGKTKHFSPARTVATFEIRKGMSFPQFYQVAFILAERDAGGGLGEVVDDLVEEARKKPIPVAAAAAGVLVPVAKAVLIEVGTVIIKKLPGLISKALDDDIFPTQVESLSLDSATFRFPGGAATGPTERRNFKAHDGEYRITYSWRVVT